MNAIVDAFRLKLRDLFSALPGSNDRSPSVAGNPETAAHNGRAAAEEIREHRGADRPQEDQVSRVHLRLDRVTHTYHQGGESVTALEGLSLSVRRGEFLAVLGPSGCGKSTMLQLLAGFETPTEGLVKMGDSVIECPSHKRGVVFQDNGLFPWKTVTENIEIGPKFRGVPQAERREKASRLIRQVGLEGFENRFPRELSGGMRQRAEIARALINDPEVLLMDEPFGALDAMTRQLMQELMLNLWRQTKKTVVFVTHDVTEALFLADRIFVLTARPGRKKEIIDIDLARPRDYSVTTTEAFNSIAAAVHEVIRVEAKKAMGLERGPAGSVEE